VFWAALLVLAYVYLGYPVVARVRATLRPQVRKKAPIEPHVSIVVIAYNEAARIEAKLENLLALDYPRDRLEIIVGSDGSTDDTVERARRFEAAGVRVQAFHRRRGKPAVINALVPQTRGEIVVFADVRQMFDPQAVRALVANFADPTTGAVSGCLVLEDRHAAGAGHGTAFYWRYERLIRATESKAGSCIGATGAIYAIRRALFEPVPEDTILDDMLVPLRMVRRGFRIVFEPEARAYDATAQTAQQEFTRKTRTIAGTFQLFARESWLLNPARNPLWFETVSHKGLRLTLPVFHGALLAATAVLALAEAWWLYEAAFAGQAMFYAAAAGGATQRNAQRRVMVLTIPYMICLMCWATIVGFTRFAMNRQQVTWERAATPVIVHHRDTAVRTLWSKLALRMKAHS
jgi:cellulose synthase/poly-beta-1,6-N-acetylglucosamine synthase-like glycosyltransferase